MIGVGGSTTGIGGFCSTTTGSSNSDGSTGGRSIWDGSSSSSITSTSNITSKSSTTIGSGSRSGMACIEIVSVISDSNSFGAAVAGFSTPPAGARRAVIAKSPIWIWSLASNGRLPLILRPLSRVPLVDFRSSMYNLPPTTRIKACLFDMFGLARTTSLPRTRPKEICSESKLNSCSLPPFSITRTLSISIPQKPLAHTFFQRIMGLSNKLWLV
ncbi:MAG: hypothetical protein BWX66_02112 [Deltaproteobacteria bacterium ADurb.Bin058]|nr:MAG: hypothetical protein BWX66_02112 [Deltaproteobacteria bacterium ADurb.Bin058]